LPGGGIYGSPLAEDLLRRRYKVIILDDLSTGKLANMRLLFGSQIQSKPNYRALGA
jgi:nucleoside-diphosphate-sugar epimerase